MQPSQNNSTNREAGFQSAAKTLNGLEIRSTVPQLLTFLVLVASCTLAHPASGQCGPDGCRPPLVRPSRPLVPVAPREIPEAVKQCYHSLVRIRCEKWGGSGTYLGDRLVITCEHVVRAATAAVRVEFPGGQAVEARVLATDFAADLALLELLGDPPADAKAIALADDSPAVGEPVYSAGYGRSQTLMVSAGRISNLDQFTVAYDPTTGLRRVRRTTEATGLTEAGDSGGAWLTRQGKLRGVVWGGRQQDRTVSATTELRDFLRGACDRWRRPFPQPDSPPAAEPPAPAPATPPVEVDLAPIVERLDAIDQRLAALEPPPEKKPPSTGLSWLAMLAAGIGAAVMYYRFEDK